MIRRSPMGNQQPNLKPLMPKQLCHFSPHAKLIVNTVVQKSPATNTADDDHNDALAPLNSYHLEAPTVRLGNFMRHSDSSGRLSLLVVWLVCSNFLKQNANICLVMIVQLQIRLQKIGLFSPFRNNSGLVQIPSIHVNLVINSKFDYKV